MSVVTKIVTPGLARDSAPEVGSQANALRRAENVVVRSPGVIETRPSFEPIYENVATDRRVRALHEFRGEVIAIDKADGVDTNWYARRLSTGSPYLGPVGAPTAGGAHPPDYAASETRFMEARDSLYFTGAQGVVKIENVTNTHNTQGLQYAGVEMTVVTDLSTRSINLGKRGYVWAYQFVFKRTDANGYVRRSAPSQRFVVSSKTALVSNVWRGDASQMTRVYFHRWLVAGDEVEIYRSRAAAGSSANPETYLANVYTLTSADITAGYFTPPADTTLDDQLGAALYTNITQGSAIAAKYPPPRAMCLASFGGVSWYGRTVSKSRAGFTVRSVNLLGPQVGPDSGTTYAIGSPNITNVSDTSKYTVGSYWTDNLTDGPTVAGTCVPALTTITAITGATTMTLSANALATATAPWSAQMYRHARSGLSVGVTTGGTHVNGSVNVTGISDTSNLRVGMGWSDSATGPATAGTLTAADTRIAAITSGTTITLTKPAIAGGAGASGYDSICVAGVYFYLWPGSVTLGTDTMRSNPWSWPTRCVPYFANVTGGDYYDSQTQIMSLVTNLCAAVNYYQLTHQSTFNVRAIPNGDTNLDYSTDPTTAILLNAVAGYATGVTFEEVGVGSGEFTVVVSRPEAIDPAPSLTSSNDDKPNRLFWSDIGEPESVPLLNYVDIGREDAPILALAPLRNALLVFKEDGVRRVTGSGPSNWTVDLLDPTLRLLRPELVTTSQNRAYAWCAGGFYEFDENGARSLSATRLDHELRSTASYFTTDSSTHGAFVVAVQQRNLVLLGVPSEPGSETTGKVYAYNQTTEAWTEWPVSWSHACESALADRCYYSRPEESAGTGLAAIDYEVRRMTSGYRGYDRSYTMGASFAVSGVTATVLSSDIGTWRPTVGDWISHLNGSLTTYRRITAVSYSAPTWTLTLEADPASGTDAFIVTDGGAFFVTDGGVFLVVSEASQWQAHEACVMALEWHPTAPAGLPVGAIARELQFQLDLREGPDPVYESSIPEYIVGGSTEVVTTPATVTSNMARVLSVQPLRAGISRQIARQAVIAPYFQSSDIFAMRIVGASIVHEGVSERTRR